VEESKRSRPAKSGGLPTSPMEDKKVIGQLFDYMQIVRMFFGVRFVFGILSTYDEWRIVWLRDAKILARATGTPTPLQPKPPQIVLDDENDDVTIFKRIPGAANDFVDAPPGKVETKLPSPKKRKCYVSKVYLRSDPELILALATVVRKMFESPIDVPRFLSGKRLYEKLDGNNARWVPRPFSALRLGEYGGNSAELFVLHIFGSGGGDGRACLAADKDGRCCVIKFHRPIYDHAALDSKAICEKEAAAWRTVWELPSVARCEGTRWAVVMKYVRVFSSRLDAEKSGVSQNTVQAAVDRVVSCGYEHTDLKWSHVGAYIDGDCLRIVFIDLSPTRFVQYDDERKDASGRMMRMLYE